jgi:hypothetical protein
MSNSIPLGKFSGKNSDKKSKEELRTLLRSKIGEKRISRSSKQKKEDILNKELKKIGIDKEKFKADLEAVRVQGGLQIDMKK